MLIVNLQNLRQENVMLSMIKITGYGEENDKNTTIKFETKVIKSNIMFNIWQSNILHIYSCSRRHNSSRW